MKEVKKKVKKRWMKRGMMPLFFIFGLVIVVGVILMVMEGAKKLGERETVVKANTAEEIKMMVDTLVGVPGEAVVEYPNNVSDFVILLGKGAVAVFKKGEIEVKREKRGFILPEGYTAVGGVENKEKACLEKKGKIITLRECEAGETETALSGEEGK